MQIVGLGNYSRVGKDSVANFMVEAINELSPHTRVLKRSLAWKLKQIAYELYAWAGMQPPEHYETREGEKDRDIVLPLLDMTPVELWVALGTKAIRNNVYDRTWLDYLLKTDHDCDILIIPDIRFPNEAEAVKEAGTLVKVVRPGYGPRPTVADRALMGYQGWNYVVGESGAMAELQRFAFALSRALIGGDWPIQSATEKARACQVEVIIPWEMP
jgi:hypothetical protein